MGDLIYPAVLLKRVSAAATHHDVVNYIKSRIGTESYHYATGEPICQIFHRKTGKSKVLVAGILLKFDEIRAKFGSKPLRNEKVFVDTVDFGLPRDPNDSEMSHFILKMHNDLKAGQGFLPAINLFTKEFNEETGGTAKLDYGIMFDDDLQNINQSMRQRPGVVIVEGGSTGRGASPTRKPTTSVKFPYNQIVYKSKMEGLQAICYLGGNPEFNKQKRQFVINDTQKLSTRTSCHGLGADGALLKIDELMKKHGYIPLDDFDKNIINQHKVDALKKPCTLCGSKYNILGISSNMGWLAANCSCDVDGSVYQWENESFFRVCLSGPSRLFFECKFDQIDVDKVEAPYKLIRGVLPAYKDVREVKATMWSAYLSHLVFEKKLMHDQQTLGQVTEAVWIEDRQIKKHSRKIVKVKFRVQTSTTWSTEGKPGMQRVTIKPLVVPASKKKNPFKTPPARVPFHLARNHLWIKGTIYNIEENAETNMSSVTVLAELPPGRYIYNHQYYLLVPKPPVHERNGIRSVLSKWTQHEKTAIGTKTLHGTVQKLWEIEKPAWYDVPGEEEQRIYMIQIATQFIPAWANLKQRILDSHLAMDISFKRMRRSVSFNARIVGIGDLIDKHPVVAPISPDEHFYVYAVLVVPFDFFIHTTKQSEPCEMRVWMVRPGVLPIAPVPNAIPAGAELDHRDRDLEFFDVDDDGYSTDGSEDGGHDERMRDVEDPYEGINVYIDASTKKQHPGNLRFVLWSLDIVRPQHHHLLFDLFLSPASHRDHSTDLKEEIEKKIGLEHKYDEIMARLNKSQKKAVTTMHNNRLSFTEGPPGTGKTFTLAMAIASLYCKEVGIQVVCAPSNFAADVVFEQLKAVKKAHNLKLMKIVRMVAHSKENNTDSDPDYLNVQVRRHWRWRSDDYINYIIDKEAKVGLAGLFHDERKALRAHKNSITREILAQADVVVCTVACASDYRIESTLSVLEELDRRLIAMYLDEASLVMIPVTLTLFHLNPVRLGFLGDDHQLAPIIADPGALTAGMNTSWMQIQRATDHFKNNNIFTMLDTQYRMAEPIARVISKFMYEGKLGSAPCVIQRKTTKYPNNLDMLNEFPELANSNMGFYTYNNFNERKVGTSWINAREVAITENLLWRLDRAKADLADVAVIAMYDSQKKLLLEMQANMPPRFKQVTLATCDSFQGKEKGIIIVNLVKANSQHNIGFMRDSRRINVALSRAKDYLLIVGHIPTFGLCQIPDIEKLITLLALERVQVKVMRSRGEGVEEHYKITMNEYMSRNGIEKYKFKK